LKPYSHREGEPEVNPGPIQLDDSEETGERYEVEALLQKKGKRAIKYLVRWKGWPEEYNEWVPARDIDKELISQYEYKKQIH
jgi:hypothetical protein